MCQLVAERAQYRKHAKQAERSTPKAKSGLSMLSDLCSQRGLMVMMLHKSGGISVENWNRKYY